MKSLFAGLLITATLSSSSVSAVSSVPASVGVFSEKSVEELKKASEGSVENDKTKQLLAEYGVNMDEANSAQRAYAQKQDEFVAAQKRSDWARAEARRAQERLEKARADQARAQAESEKAEAAVKKSHDDVGLTAATIYKQGGVSLDPALSALLLDADDVQDSLDANVMMERVMSQQAGTLQSARQAEAVQGEALVRAESITVNVEELEGKVSASAQKAQRDADEAMKLRNEAQRLLAESEAKAKDTRAQYERAVAEAEREAEAFRKRQEQLLAQAKVKAQPVKDQGRVHGAISSGSSVIPLPLPSLVNRVTSGYGWRVTPAGTADYGGKGGYVHAGIDYGLACGSPLFAVADGTVWLAGPAGSAGNAIGLSHGIVNGYAFATRYHHLSAVSVSSGDKVKRGQLIGYSGTTGNSNGCHLHFETMVNGEKVDPAPYMGTEMFR